jgi:hypothetical protein
MLGHGHTPAAAQSGGAHTRTCEPSARNRTANPTIGSMPPREAYVDNNTHVFTTPISVCSGASVDDYAA